MNLSEFKKLIKDLKYGHQISLLLLFINEVDNCDTLDEMLEDIWQKYIIEETHKLQDAGELLIPVDSKYVDAMNYKQIFEFIRRYHENHKLVSSNNVTDLKEELIV